MTTTRILFLAMLAAGTTIARAQVDPNQWLEDVASSRSMQWVQAENTRTAKDLKKSPQFDSLYQDALAALDSKSRIPSVEQVGAWLYNFWQDEDHPRGVYRRTTLDEFRRKNPKWDTVLDVDALSRHDGKKWSFHGMDCLAPEYRRCLVFLSPGGGDAVELREFDSKTLKFIADGFHLPTAKMRVAWRDQNSLFVATDFGPGSMTESGYPRIAKLWQRGTPLNRAHTLFTGAAKSVSMSARRLRSSAADIDIINEQTSFWTASRYWLTARALQPLQLPDKAVIEGAFQGKLLILLNSDWQRGGQRLAQGSVIIASPKSLTDASGSVEVLIQPRPHEVVQNVSSSRDAVLVSVLDNVRGRLYRYTRIAGGGWQRQAIAFPNNGALSVTSLDEESGSFFVKYEDFLTPPTLFYSKGPDFAPERIKAQAATFDASGFKVEQYFATSKDGTRIPYFAVMAKNTEFNGNNPTHLFAYGGFRVSLTPSYSGSYEDLAGAYGKMWLERGGVFVSANIRGGGEFGPAWHDAVLLKHHKRAFEDFEAVARDLVTRKITTPKHLGIEGRSNGGLLVSASFIRHPELYGAVVCGVPLADMRRYNKLGAGASWMAEYGNPDDPDMWAYMKTYSPYQNLKAGQAYPPVFFFSSTQDDRVHPAHARKMVARMEKFGYPVRYYENTEGGHHGSSTHKQLAYRLALAYTHLWRHLKQNHAESQ